MFFYVIFLFSMDMTVQMFHLKVNYIFMIIQQDKNNTNNTPDFQRPSKIMVFNKHLFYFYNYPNVFIFKFKTKKHMNKQNSMGVDNEMSTEINESMKSYSSRFKQLKAIKSNSKCKNGEVLPFKREKAAIVIQRFWRLRNILKKKFYQQLIEEIDQSNRIIQFQNKALDQLISIYDRDCQQFQAYYEATGIKAVQGMEKQANHLIKQMAVITFKMERKIISQEEICELYQQYEEWKARNRQLLHQKQQLKIRLGGEMQQEQQDFLRKIKQENINLLRVSRQKNEAQKVMRQKMIQICKFQMKL